jgi:hypothetical protein
MSEVKATYSVNGIVYISFTKHLDLICWSALPYNSEKLKGDAQLSSIGMLLELPTKK